MSEQAKNEPSAAQPAQPAEPIPAAAPAAPVAAAAAPAPAATIDYAKLVQDEVARATGPLTERLATTDFAYKNGVTMDQAAYAREIQKKYQGMPDDRAIVMARMDKPDLFPRIGFDPRLHGTTPVSGIPAPMRTPEASRPKTYEQELAEVEAKGSTEAASRHEREQIARKHFREAIKRAHLNPTPFQ